MRTRGQRRVRRSVTAGAVIALMALGAACSAGVETMSEGAGDAEGGSAGRAALDHGPLEAPASTSDRDIAGPDALGGPGASGPKTGSAFRPAAQTRAVIRRGEISLVSKEMNRARGEIDDLLGRHGGYLASEDTTNDRAGRPERSVLVLRVPEPAFDTTMDELAEVGRAKRADRSSEDVTTQVIDVDTRVATQETSLSRLRRFLSQATTVDDMIRLESEIAERQATLESLKAQQKYLRDNTTMSTITVRLRTPYAPPAPPEEDETGFLAGLEDGWHALRTVLVGAATVGGALLPFAVTLALVGVPTWLLLRTVARRRRDSATPRVAPEAG